MQFRYGGPHAGLISPIALIASHASLRMSSASASMVAPTSTAASNALEADPRMSEQTSRVPLAQLGKFWRQQWQGWWGIATAVVRQDEDHAGPGVILSLIHI